MAAQAIGTRGVRLHRADHRPAGLGVLQQRGDRRDPPRRRTVLGHCPDEQQHPRRDRRHRRRRLDADPLPPRDLGRPVEPGSPTPRSPRPVHGVRVDEGPGRHRAADRPPGPRPEQAGRGRAGRAVPRLALHAVFSDSPFELVQAEEQHATTRSWSRSSPTSPADPRPRHQGFSRNAAWLAIAAMATGPRRRTGEPAFARPGRDIRRDLIAVAAAPPGTAAATSPCPAEGWHREPWLWG